MLRLICCQKVTALGQCNIGRAIAMDTERTSENSGEAWDCDLFFVSECLDYDLGLDEEDDEGDWQVIVLDRFGDRLVNGELR